MLGGRLKDQKISNLAITVQLLYRFGPVGLRAQAGSIHSPTRNQRTLEQVLEGIRNMNIARSHALRL